MKCIYCVNFTMREHPKHAAVGLGVCKVKWSSGMKVFVRFDGEPECDKREPAKDMAAREKWVSEREGGK